MKKDRPQKAWRLLLGEKGSPLDGPLPGTILFHIANWLRLKQKRIVLQGHGDVYSVKRDGFLDEPHSQHSLGLLGTLCPLEFVGIRMSTPRGVGG